MTDKKLKVITYGIDDLGLLGFKALSFVDFPAIEVDFVHLNKTKYIKMASNEERRMVYGPVMIPDQLIYRRDDDTGEEYYITFPKETIREVAFRMMKQGMQGNHTAMHAVSVGGCNIVETWIKESEMDKSIELGFTELPVGTWFVGDHVENDAVWNEVKDGTFKGFSIEAMFKDIGVDMIQTRDEIILRELEKLLKE